MLGWIGTIQRSCTTSHDGRLGSAGDYVDRHLSDVRSIEITKIHWAVPQLQSLYINTQSENVGPKKHYSIPTNRAVEAWLKRVLHFSKMPRAVSRLRFSSPRQGCSTDGIDISRSQAHVMRRLQYRYRIVEARGTAQQSTPRNERHTTHDT